MADDPSKRGEADRIRVNVHEAHEMEYWTKKFGCSADQLIAAVKDVGVMVKDVEAYLKQHM